MYYPKSQIKPNLYTSGNEYALESTPNNSYKGHYYKTSIGKSYTGKTPTTFTGVADIGVAGFTAAIGGSTAVFAYRLQIDFQGTSSVGDNARLRDWWIDTEMGLIYFNNSYPFFEWNAVKASYIYGERYVEKAIEDVCTKMVAIELLMSDDRSVLIPEGTQNVDLTSKIQLWQRDIEATLPRYREVVVFA